MLFNGGGCEQSDNTQALQFTCVDENGGPPEGEGDMAFIVVTDIKGLGITYFSGLVAVGDTYPINDNGDRFEADMFITISTPDRSTVLQRVQFHSSCSRNLELKNRFGASQLVEFTNDLQGTVSCFVTFSFSLAIEVPITATTSDPILLQTLTASTNFAGDLDLSDQVAGRTIEPGSAPVIVTLEGTINASSQMRYTLFFEITGIIEATGQPCTGMDMLSFIAGNVPGGGIPTAVPPTPPTAVPPTPPPVAPIPTATTPPATLAPTKKTKTKKSKKAKSMKVKVPKAKKVKSVKKTKDDKKDEKKDEKKRREF